MDQKRPGGEMKSQDPSAPTRSQLLPFGGQWQELTTKPYFLPGVVASLVMALLFTFIGKRSAVITVSYAGLPVGVPLYIVVLAACLTLGGMYAVYRMAGKPKAWWMMPAVAALIGVLAFSPLMGSLQGLFGIVGDEARGDTFVVRFIKMFFLAGLPEEVLKALPALAGLLIGRKLIGGLAATHPSRQFAVLEPLDGVLIGAAAGLGFAFAETLFQYVPGVILNSPATVKGLVGVFAQMGVQVRLPRDTSQLQDIALLYNELARRLGEQRATTELALVIAARQGVGLELMIPRLLHVVTGHAAYAGILGYFIGLVALRPQGAVKTLLTGLLIVATLHGLWNSIDHSVLTMTALACVSFFALSICIMKGRTLSPERSQLVASQLIDRFSRGAMAGAATPSQAAAPVPRPMGFAAPVAPPAAPVYPPHVPPAAAAPVPPAAPAPAASITWDDDSSLRIIEVGSARLPGTVGARLYERQVPGLRALNGDTIVAEVTANPSDPSVLGLKNLSDQPWQVTLADGQQRELLAGRSIRLAEGMRIQMGALAARVR